MIIYKITNIKNGRVYVGQTVGSLGKRWNEHSTSMKNSPLYNAFRKYGKENFKIETICSALSPEHLNSLEQHFIKYFNSFHPDGYNLTSGGDSAYTRSEHSRDKQRSAMLGHTVSVETRAKISKTLTGRPGIRKGAVLSAETRQKISEIQIGRKASEETKAKMKASKLGGKAYNSKPVMCIETGIVYGSTGEAARALNLQQTSISAICLGKRKSTGGFTFKFIEIVKV